MDDAVALDPETWVDQHGDSLFRFAVSRVQDPEIASDLVQETFLAALRVRDTYAGRSSVRTWLIAILKHKIADCLRKIGREQRFQEGWAPRTGPKACSTVAATGVPRRSTGAATRSASTNVVNSGRCSGDACRRSLPTWLTRSSNAGLEGLSREAICRDLNITPENLSVRLFRARLLLRRCLEMNWFCGGEARSRGLRALTCPTAATNCEGR